jgi:hypothetical protein
VFLARYERNLVRHYWCCAPPRLPCPSGGLASVPVVLLCSLVSAGGRGYAPGGVLCPCRCGRFCVVRAGLTAEVDGTIDMSCWIVWMGRPASSSPGPDVWAVSMSEAGLLPDNVCFIATVWLFVIYKSDFRVYMKKFRHTKDFYSVRLPTPDS